MILTSICRAKKILFFTLFFLSTFFLLIESSVNLMGTEELQWAEKSDESASTEVYLEKALNTSMNDPFLKNLAEDCKNKYISLTQWTKIRNQLLHLIEKNQSLQSQTSLMKSSINADLQRNALKLRRERHLIELKTERLRESWIISNCPPLK